MATVRQTDQEKPRPTPAHERALAVAKIGRSSVHWSRPSEGTPKTVTITRAADGWSVCLSCADVPCQPLPLSGQATGIELGLESLAPLADGSQIAHPRILRVAALNLKRAPRRVARRKKGSQRRRKAVVRRAKAHQHTRNQRRDFPHQEACKLLRAYDVIYHDELRVRTRVPNHSLAKSLADAGWSAFLAIRTFTAASAGKRVHAVTPAYTSQACSGCGVLVSKGLSVRWHECPDGGTSLHRDHNAALNILRLGRTQESNVGRDTAFRR